MSQQLLHDTIIAIRFCHRKSGQPFTRLHIRVSALFEEQLDEFFSAVPRGDEQRGFSLFVLGVYVQAPFEQEFDDKRLCAFHDSPVQVRVSSGIRNMDYHALSQPRLQFLKGYVGKGTGVGNPGDFRVVNVSHHVSSSVPGPPRGPCFDPRHGCAAT